MRGLRIVAGGMVCLFSLPIMFIGAQFLWSWVRLHFGQPYYVGHDYLSNGLLWLIWGLLVFALAGYSMMRRRGSAFLLLAGFLLLGVAAVAIPSHRLPGGFTESARLSVIGKVRTLGSAMDEWAKKNGRLPANETELRDVWSEYIGQPEERSPYYRAGQRLVYRLVYMGNAAGPYLREPGMEPAVIYCAVRQDLKQFWITATGVDADVGSRVVFVKGWDEPGPFVVEGKLEAKTAG